MLQHNTEGHFKSFKCQIKKDIPLLKYAHFSLRNQDVLSSAIN
jgi:hypothetical protein